MKYGPIRFYWIQSRLASGMASTFIAVLFQVPTGRLILGFLCSSLPVKKEGYCGSAFHGLAKKKCLFASDSLD